LERIQQIKLFSEKKNKKRSVILIAFAPSS
jgi:hypothetical protein